METRIKPEPTEARTGSTRRAWLIPLLWLLLPALAAVLPWAWRRQHPPPRPAPPPLPPITLTGDRRRDQEAILARAADLLIRAAPVYSDERLADPASLMGEIGIRLLPLNRARGTAVVRQAIARATRPADRVTPVELEHPERSSIGPLVHLAQSLQPYPALSRLALQTADQQARANPNAVYRVYALCLFAREAFRLDPARARDDLAMAQRLAAFLPGDAPADPVAATAAITARLEGADEARPLVEHAIRSIPAGPARPLVEARLAAWLVDAAPARARALAKLALGDVGSQTGGVQAFRRSGVPGSEAVEGASAETERSTPNSQTPRRLNSQTPERPSPLPQYHDVAVMLAASHSEIALMAANHLPPLQRAAALVEMGGASEARDPARSEAYYRLALREAKALPDGPARQQAVVDAARGLALFDLTAACAALGPRPDAVPASDRMSMAVRAAQRQPEAVRRLIQKLRGSNPEALGTIEVHFEVALALVTAEPDLKRALAMAQQQEPELQAAALLAVARRLEKKPVRRSERVLKQISTDWRSRGIDRGNAVADRIVGRPEGEAG